jgi:hypothetical protein
VGRSDAISFLKDTFPRKFPGINSIPNIETERKSIIYTLKARNSSGCDEITSKILEASPSLICHSLNYICNHSLLIGIFPTCLNISII